MPMQMPVIPVKRRCPTCLVIFALTLSACAAFGGRWEHPNLPKEAWEEDEIACRNEAFERASWEFQTFEERWRDGYDTTVSVARKWEARQTAMRERELLEACMIDKGYRWVSEGGKADAHTSDADPD